MDDNKKIEVWEQGSKDQPPRLKGEFTATTFDEAVTEMLKQNQALNDLYRKDGDKHFLYQFQLFETKEEAEKASK